MKTLDLYAKVRNEVAQMEEIRQAAIKEDRTMSKDELEKFNKGAEIIQHYQDQIAAEERFAKIDKDMNDPFYDEKGKTTGKTVGDVKDEHKRAFSQWMREGAKSLTADQRTILGVQGDGNTVRINNANQAKRDDYYEAEKRASNSVLLTETNWIPTELDNVMNATKKAYAGWMDATTVIYTPTGAPLDLPYYDDAGNDGYGEAEGTDAIASSADLTASKQTLGSYWYSSTGLKVGWSELRDVDFPVSEFIYKPLTERLMRAINAVATTGATGGSNPLGIVTAGGVGENVMNDAAITNTDLNNLLKDVDWAYHQGDKSGWMFSSSTMFGIAATVKSSTYNTEPLWQPSLAAGIPSTLHGYRYWINNNMASSGASGGAGGTIMLFGDFSYQVNRFAGPLIISRLEERYAETGMVGFLLSQYFDSECKIPATSTYAPFKRMYEITT